MSGNKRQSTGMSSHPRLETVDDLAKLPGIQDDVIVSCLRERFMADTIYTGIGTLGLVAVNPHKYISSSADTVLHKYAAEYRNTSDDKTPLPPHIFQLANNAYYHMRRTAQDQCMLMIGETGSGKSESRRLAIKSLLELSVSNPGKKGSKLATQVPSAEFILESFGSARTLFNPNASRFGKYTELQFNDKGRLAGVKTLDYYLERARVSGAPSGERNFHIFYYLVAGATQEERQHLHLLDKTNYRYLGQRAAPVIRQDGGRDEDAIRFEQLKMALKNVGLSKRHVAQTCQLLAAILHLGNLDFTIDRNRNEDAAVVRNLDVLDIVSDFLGVRPAALEAVLSYKTKLVKKELATVFLDPDGAADNRDDLAKALYSLLFAWLNEHINQKLCKDDFATLIALVDLPGPQNMTSRPNSLDQFCINFANERLHNFIQKRLFESHVGEYTNEGVIDVVPRTSRVDNTECIRLLQNMPGGLIHIMDDQARRQPKKTDHTMVEAFAKRWGNHSSFKTGGMDRSGFPTFTVSHYHGPVTYSAEGFLERNLEAINPDFISLLRGVNFGDASDDSGSINPFVKGLFTTKAIATQAHPRHEETIVSAQQPVKPMRAPSTRRKGGTIRRRQQSSGLGDIDEKGDADDDDTPRQTEGGVPTVAGEFRTALDTLFSTLEEAQAWFVFCINPNDAQLPNQLEGRSVKGQVRGVSLGEVAKRAAVAFEVGMTPDEFCERYREPMGIVGVTEGEPRELVDQTRTALGLGPKDVVQGREKVFLSQAAFHRLEDYLRAQDTEEVKRNRMRDAEAAAGLDPRDTGDPFAPYAVPGEAPHSPYAGAGGFGDPFNQSSQQLPLVANAAMHAGGGMYDDEYDDHKSMRSEDFDQRTRLTSRDDASVVGSESYAPSRNMFQNADHKALLDKEVLPGEVQEGETTEVYKESSARRRWVALCWILTFWVPNWVLEHVGRMKRIDIRQAWREKLALNLLIWFICACAVFVIAALGPIICPTEHVFSTGELADHGKSNPNNMYTSIRGEVFDFTAIIQSHQQLVPVVTAKALQNYAGKAADDIFPVQVSALCNGADASGVVSPYVKLDTVNRTDENAQYHDFRVFSNESRPDWYFEVMTQMRWNNRVGFVGIDMKEVKNMAGQNKAVAVYNGLIYDLTAYVQSGSGVQPPPGQSPPPNINREFIHPAVKNLFTMSAGQDITKQLDSLQIDRNILARQKVCLRNLFAIGKVDTRNSPACQFSTIILLVLSILMTSIIGFKFLASINLSGSRAPENHDKFVILQVPCYTEGESSIKRTVDSLAMTKYDDKRKLIVVICDGMVIGAGNEKSTPAIVLSVLGADPNQEPEPLSFLSLGEGSKQHNMGKVYSGLYEVSGHVVPYLVLVKVGKPSERAKPGNRGKRDTQMLVMRFLNKVHFSAAMNPFELEMYHQIKNVIGVNPTFYEYLLTVDADTTVAPLSLNRLISAMIHDKKLLGVCGETQISNAKQSLITMMQVYEYFISHHMAKAFESLFGSVTCLPGCFTLVRLRTPDTYKPLLISNQIIHDYSENRVDTLHMKNLLHLGEDRYLTTLLLKHFPEFKTQFVRDALAYTVAPDDWQVLMSQRRRWINSTVHNLGELVFLDQLCGFCCFSMRFVVLIDLLSTLIAPVTVAYIVYLIYLTAGEHKQIPQLSIIMIAAVYGLQAMVFILRRKWDMIGWMVFYIISIPATSFFLPLYSFWKMDDFSWGQTRLVVGESGKKMIVHDEGKFDPKSIPLKTWEEYENELWDKESNHSIGSWVPPQKQKNDGYAQSATASVYGRETYYEPSHAGGYMQPPEYHSGRNTPYGGGFAQSPLRATSDAGSLYQPAPMRPATNYLDMPIPMTASPDGSGISNAEIERAVENILRGADLNTVTKREVRRKLEEQFGMDLAPRKLVINAAIDRALLAHAT